MKNNLKTKVMLAVLAGGMLCANGAFAQGELSWYGTTTGSVVTVSASATNTGVNLTITDTFKDSSERTVASVSGGIYGGYTTQSDVAVTNNTITFNTTNASTIQADIFCGLSTTGNATNNSLIINGGVFTSDYIYGGRSEKCSGGSATNNSVTINDGTFSRQIYGGYTDGGSATNNSVIINGGTFIDKFSLFGGFGNTSSGNILNLKTKITGNADQVAYFQTMNFTLPANITEGDKIMLKTENLGVDGQGGTATINVYAANGAKLNAGDKITLVDSDNTMDNYVAGDILGGAAKLEYEKIVNAGTDINGDTDMQDLVITLLEDFGGSGGDTATTKAVAEGIAASLAFVNQGADMVAGSGIDGLYVADSENPTIAAFSGNKTRYNTGSHVDIHGWNALAGVALNNKESFSHGVFVEIGNGDIDTYAALNGSGSSDYKGGGYMLRKDMGKGWTIDGAVRAGRVETSWGNDTKGGYEAKQTYYGAHVTFNKMLKEYGEQKLNGYLRYTFTHLGSDSVNLDGTHYGFDSVNSHRTRLGARMVDEGQNGFELYYGAAWEYGFGGDCDATVNGVTTSGPAVDGSNGVFEVGGTWSDNKWEISAGLEGYVGAKRGVAGGMNFIYKF